MNFFVSFFYRFFLGLFDGKCPVFHSYDSLKVPMSECVEWPFCRVNGKTGTSMSTGAVEWSEENNQLGYFTIYNVFVAVLPHTLYILVHHHEKPIGVG